VDDIIDGLLAMGIKEEAVGEAINLGSGKEHRVIDLANMVNALAGNEAGIKYVERRDWDVKTRLLSSIEKAKELLDYKPQMEFEDSNLVFTSQSLLSTYLIPASLPASALTIFAKSITLCSLPEPRFIASPTASSFIPIANSPSIISST